MSKTVEVEIEVQIARAPAEVFAFVADPENAPDWLSEFREVVKLTDGPIAVGPSFATRSNPESAPAP